MRWFWEGDPLNLTIHLLGADDEQPAADDAWYPLEWDDVDREMARTERILGEEDVHHAGEALAASFPLDEEGEGDLPEDLEAHVPAILEALRQLPDALRAHGLPLHERFAACAAHFEGWGAADSLEKTASAELVALLDEHHELPEE